MRTLALFPAHSTDSRPPDMHIFPPHENPPAERDSSAPPQAAADNLAEQPDYSPAWPVQRSSAGATPDMSKTTAQPPRNTRRARVGAFRSGSRFQLAQPLTQPLKIPA